MTLEQISKQWVQNCLDKEYKTRDKDYENISYKGNTIYSYGQHWEIATYDDTTGIFIINDSRCSQSTNNHTSIVTSAICEAMTGNAYNRRHPKIVFVPCRTVSWCGKPTAVISHNAAEINILGEIQELKDKQAKGRNTSRAYADRAYRIIALNVLHKEINRLNKSGILV